MTTPSQVLVYRYFPKFKTLEQMTLAAFSGSNATEVNVYIDVTKMVTSLYSPFVSINYPLDIAATLINLCAHMRSYYRQNHSVETNFFLVYSTMMNDYNCNLIQGYNQMNLEKKEANCVTTDAINISMTVLEELCLYLPYIYFKKDIYEPSVIIYNLIQKESTFNNNNPNIIITNDPLCYQVTCHVKDTFVFIDDKRNESWHIVGHDNAIFSHFTSKTGTGKSKLKEDAEMYHHCNCINPELLGLLTTISNLPSRGVRSIFGSTKAIRTIYGLIERGELENRYSYNIQYLYDAIFKRSQRISLESFTMRFEAIDLLQNFLYYKNTPFAEDITYHNNLEDPEAVQAINNRYFTNTPIDLNRL